MSKQYRVGVIGFAHMHINSLIAQFGQQSQVQLTACADTTPAQAELREAPYTRGWNKRNALEKLGVAQAYDDYRTMLAQQKFDVVICCSENARHAEVVEACAAVGAHVIVEKPMASSLAHGLRMVRAAQAGGIQVIVNWPTTWSPAMRKTKELIDAGAIGRVIEVKWRGGHLGPLGSGVSHPGVSQTAGALNDMERGATWWHQKATGGGAMLDYCCYGSKLARWYVGEQALAAVGMRANLNSQWGDAEDNAAMLVRFPHAMGLFEGSWTTLDHGVPPGPIVYGTHGALVVERPKDAAERVRQEQGGGQTTIHEPEPLPAGQQNIAEAFIAYLDTGAALHPTLNLTFNLEVMAILDAGVRAADSGKLEMVETATWCVG